MKALSLKQPFAELILQRKKKIELRKWNTKFRGEFLIHTSKVSDKESMVKFGFKELPCGCIVGKATLVDVPLWVIVPTRKLKLELIRRLNSLALRPGGEPIKVLLLGQLEQSFVNYLSQRTKEQNKP